MGSWRRRLLGALLLAAAVCAYWAWGPPSRPPGGELVASVGRGAKPADVSPSDPSGAQRPEPGEYRNGRKHGPWLEWYASGARRSQLEFRDGQADGPWLEWYEDGTPKSEGFYAKGEETGVWTFWRADGTIVERGSMHEGERDREWIGWYPSGAERYRRYYARGVATAWEEWDPNGVSVQASDRRP